MPAEWVQNENTWEKAKDAFKESYGKEPKDDKDYAILTTIYKNMGGKVKSQIINRARHALQIGDIELAKKIAKEIRS